MNHIIRHQVERVAIDNISGTIQVELLEKQIDIVGDGSYRTERGGIQIVYRRYNESGELLRQSPNKIMPTGDPEYAGTVCGVRITFQEREWLQVAEATILAHPLYIRQQRLENYFNTLDIDHTQTEHLDGPLVKSNRNR